MVVSDCCQINANEERERTSDEGRMLESVCRVKMHCVKQ